MTDILLAEEAAATTGVGTAFVTVVIFIVGVGLFLSGLHDRREDGRGDGLVKIILGAVVVGLVVLSTGAEIIIESTTT